MNQPNQVSECSRSPLSTQFAYSQAYHLWLHLLSTSPASWEPWSHLLTSPHTSEGIFWVLQPSYKPRLVSFTELQCAFPKLPDIAGFKQLFHQHTDIDLSHITTFVDNLWIRITTTLPSLMNISNWRTDQQLPTDLPTLHTWSESNQAWTTAKTETKVYSTETVYNSGTMKEFYMPRSYHKHTSIMKGQDNPTPTKPTNSMKMFSNEIYLD